MSQEIVYTSAPKGLKPGSQGFCTVISSQGMAKNLADRLESMSGYRHVIPPHETKAHLNPVNYSHLQIKLGGQAYQVISRIANAGLDYTQRSNKIAHHIALEQDELVPAGPAAMLAAPSVCRSEWKGETRIIPSNRTLPEVSVNLQPCNAWKKVTGDKGWAGVVAAKLIASQSGKPYSVIFALGTDCLPLVEEVFQLIPQGKRWGITFSTYFTKLPAGLDCRFRFILDGTPEATRLRNDPHGNYLDLCKKLGSAPEDNELVRVARSGMVTPQTPTNIGSKAKNPRNAAPHTTPTFVSEDEDVEEISPMQPESLPPSRKKEEVPCQIKAKPKTEISQWPVGHTGNAPLTQRPDADRGFKGKFLLVCLVLLLVAGFSGTVYFYSSDILERLTAQNNPDEGITTDQETSSASNDSKQDSAATQQKNKPTQSETTEQEQGSQSGNKQLKQSSTVRDTKGKQSLQQPPNPKVNTVNESTASSENKPDSSDSTDESPKSAQASEDAEYVVEEHVSGPFTELKKNGPAWDLPGLIQTKIGEPIKYQQVELASIDADEIELRLIVPKEPLNESSNNRRKILNLKLEPLKLTKKQRWNIIFKKRGAVDGVEWGHFAFENKTLLFKWNNKGNDETKREFFRFMKLEITSGKETAVCSMIRPQYIEPHSLNESNSPEIKYGNNVQATLFSTGRLSNQEREFIAMFTSKRKYRAYFSKDSTEPNKNPSWLVHEKEHHLVEEALTDWDLPKSNPKIQIAWTVNENQLETGIKVFPIIYTAKENRYFYWPDDKKQVIGELNNAINAFNKTDAEYKKKYDIDPNQYKKMSAKERNEHDEKKRDEGKKINIFKKIVFSKDKQLSFFKHVLDETELHYEVYLEFEQGSDGKPYQLLLISTDNHWKSQPE